MTLALVMQHCNECGGEFYTSRIHGTWVRKDAAMQELILISAMSCPFCRSSELGKPIFDNGGMLLINGEVGL